MAPILNGAASSVGPSPALLELVSDFLTQHGLLAASKALEKELAKRKAKGRWTNEKEATSTEASLEEIFTQWVNDTRDKTGMSSSADGTIVESSEDNSENDSTSDSSSSSEDSSEDDGASSSSSSEDEPLPKVISAPTKDRKSSTKERNQPSIAARKRKAEESSDSSSSDSSASDTGREQSTKRPKLIPNNHLKNGTPPARRKSEMSSRSSSSEDDSTDSSSSSSDEGDDVVQVTAPKPKFVSKTPSKPVVEETSVVEAVSQNGNIHASRLSAFTQTKKHVGAKPTPLAQLSSQGGSDNYVSNVYQSYDYADRAFKDLSVTRGKGFTKEKNKKKRGSYRGGTIDVGPGKGFKFDD